MIALEQDELVFRFPEVHDNATCTIGFQRTLRIPDDDQDYPLPPGLGGFPLRHLDDFAERVPEKWRPRGGVVMPMHQSEAMWINFDDRGYPFAIKVATGKINAVTGETWVDHLNRDPQDYVVLPKQPWLDGYCVEKGVIRQFIAMPLGSGFSVEEQITGEAEHGGIQIVAYPMKAERYEKLNRSPSSFQRVSAPQSALCEEASSPDMGLAPGGRMEQEIYDDPYDVDAWDLRHSSRCFVTIANPEIWKRITGQKPPTTSPSAQDYTAAGLPWFEYYGAGAKPVEGSQRLAGLKSVFQFGADAQDAISGGNASIAIRKIVRLGGRRSDAVRESSF
jgi:hypothetical protein